jgi:hypothetical protein
MTGQSQNSIRLSSCIKSRFEVGRFHTFVALASCFLDKIVLFIILRILTTRRNKKIIIYRSIVTSQFLLGWVAPSSEILTTAVFPV